MIQKYFLVVILIIVVIVLFLKSLNIEYFKVNHHPLSEGYADCPNKVDKDDKDDLSCCNQLLNNHIKKSVDDDDDFRYIHKVDPTHSCCIKSCINDFTNVDCDKYPKSEGTIDYNPVLSCSGEEGTVRNDFKDTNTKNLHYFFSSGCAECVKNFKGAVELLANPDADECEETTQ